MQFVHAPSQPAEWDGQWRLIDWDPYYGISQWWLYHDGKATIRTLQHNVDQLLAQNAAERADNQGKRWGDGKKVATLPMNVFNKLGLDDAISNKDSKFLKKVLNDSDFSKFRTFEGNL